MSKSKKKSDLPKRVITAIIGASIFMGVLLYGGDWGAGLIAAIISSMMLIEFGHLVFELRDRASKIRFIVTVSVIAHALSVMHHPLWVDFFCIATGVLLFYFLVGARKRTRTDLSQHTREMMLGTFGFLYLSFFTSFLVRIREVDHGLYWLIFYFLVIWGMDIGAYFVGKGIGKTKLFSSVSPKKTVEGLFGGLVLSGFVGWLFARFYIIEHVDLASHYANFMILALALFIGAASQAGDLIESLLKRAFDKKDAGSLLPGHGGFLDRFDGVVFTLPVMYTCVTFVTEVWITVDF